MKKVLRVALIILGVLVVLFGAYTAWANIPSLIRVLLIIVGVLVVLFGAFTAWAYIPSPRFEPAAYEPIRPDYWPTEGFRTSTPEEQGMDSEKLLEIVDFCNAAHVKDPGNAIDSISVYRNGYLVADFYFNPLFPRGNAHVIHSVTNKAIRRPTRADSGRVSVRGAGADQRQEGLG